MKKALLAIAVVALLGQAAHAQEVACGTLADQPEAVFSLFIARYGMSFPLQNAAACEKLVKAAVSACHKAVSDTASCLTGVVSGIYKGAKPVCSTFKNQSGCLDDAKASADLDKADIAGQADGQHAVCDGEFAGAIADDCELGLPM